MKTQSAILVETGRPLEVDDLQVPALRPGQVLVEIHYSGVCHTQLLECRGYRGKDAYLPHCLGHEGSGKVCEVGSGVTKVKPGDRVILSWMKGGGTDVPGSKYDWNGRVVNAGAITTFSRHSVISENRLTPLPSTIAMEDAALLGCAVATGMGAVFNTGCAGPGQSLAVFGAGGVGLCAIAAAAIAGCVPIIAVDPVPSRLDVAQRLGATHRVDPREGDAGEAISRLLPTGIDIAIEATGRPAVMAQALRVVRPRGGVAVIIGNARHGEKLEIDPGQLNQGKQVRGSWGGDNQPDKDFPRYCRLVESQKLALDPLRSSVFRLEEVNQALEALESGAPGRPLLRMVA
jgi:S-(hydroxymethyl)glutathione dehydrogenase/alcohol dehydrogenase